MATPTMSSRSTYNLPPKENAGILHEKEDIQRFSFIYSDLSFKHDFNYESNQMKYMPFYAQEHTKRKIVHLDILIYLH